MSDRIRELLAIMARLRGPDGCPWDRRQTPASIVPYTIEEAYEVADAAERGDMEQLKDELGDLLFQVVFYAQMAGEAGDFDFDAVAGAICDKLVRRHPHVFGDGGPLSVAEHSAVWENIKERERNVAAESRVGRPNGSYAEVQSPGSHLDGVPQALPALMRAYKLSKRAARVGFDFDRADQAADKVEEELQEVRAAAAANSAGAPSTAIFEEVGDLLFAAANLARKLEVDAEAALRAANAKFERRFRGMESLATGRGEVFAELNLEAQEGLWLAVKRDE